MNADLMPLDIYGHLAERVLGQEEALKSVAVAVYKHVNRIGGARILLIGNSGTGKTTIMKAIEELYAAHEGLTANRAVAIMNARTLLNEQGDVDVFGVFRSLESRVTALLGENRSPNAVLSLLEHSTVCLDEIDKISGRVAGKPDVTGITLQQALLTIIEGERILYRTKVYANGAERMAKLPIDTRRMLFICGGAFEELYEQVFNRVENKEDERRLKEVRDYDRKHGMRTAIHFTLRDYLKMSDLFHYGMAPQFLSRFSSLAVLSDLERPTLRNILLRSVDSPYAQSRRYFKTMGIDLELEDGAVDVIVDHAAENTRLGARALWEVFGRVVVDLEFDPLGSPGLRETDAGGKALTVDADLAVDRLATWEGCGS